MGESLCISWCCGRCSVFANALWAKLSPCGLGAIRYDHGQLCIDRLWDSSLFNLSIVPAWEKRLSKNVYNYRK